MLVCWIKLLVDSFFFQAEDGIRDIGVTGVQTCALPIYLYFAMLLRERFDEAQDWCQQGVQRFPRDPNFVDCELRILGWSAKGEHQIATAWRLLTNAETMDSGGPTTVPWLDRRLMVAAVV